VTGRRHSPTPNRGDPSRRQQPSTRLRKLTGSRAPDQAHAPVGRGRRQGRHEAAWGQRPARFLRRGLSKRRVPPRPGSAWRVNRSIMRCTARRKKGGERPGCRQPRGLGRLGAASATAEFGQERKRLTHGSLPDAHERPETKVVTPSYRGGPRISIPVTGNCFMFWASQPVPPITTI
jgi:hypothetical protein